MKLFQWLLGVFIGILPLNLQGYNYVFQDLGTLTTDLSYAGGINNQNAVVGFVQEGEKIHNFIWKQNEGLVFLPEQTYQAPLINNHNQVADIFWHKKTITKNWFKTTEKYSKHIYIYNNDNRESQDIGSPQQWEVQELENWQNKQNLDDKKLGILSFNDDQQMLISNANKLYKATRFAIWQNGNFTEIDPNFISHTYEMNNQGWILAKKKIKKENIDVSMLVLYHPIKETIIEIKEDTDIVYQKLNDQGQVIMIQGCLKKPKELKGFLWDSKKGITELEDFVPILLNNCNQMIGFKKSEIQNTKFNAAIWTPSGVNSLNQIIESAMDKHNCSRIISLNGFNDHGYIIGNGLFDGKHHGFVLIPQ